MELVPISSPPQNSDTCSFCGRSNELVDVLLVGPCVMICDQCVDHCVDEIARVRAHRKIKATANDTEIIDAR